MHNGTILNQADEEDVSSPTNVDAYEEFGGCCHLCDFSTNESITNKKCTLATNATEDIPRFSSFATPQDRIYESSEFCRLLILLKNSFD